MASRPRNYTDSKTLNPRPTKTTSHYVQQIDQTLSFPDGNNVIFNLVSYSKTELKELKDKCLSKIERIQSFVKQIEVRELELVRVENVESRKNVNSKIIGQKRVVQATQSFKNIGQKRVAQVTPDREVKRKRLVKTTELNSMQTRKDEEMRKCGVILEKLMKHEHGRVFNEPVDVVGLGFRDYRQIVKCPMDLGTVKLKLDMGVYENSVDFAKDVRLTFRNARLYNRKGDDVHTMATVLLEMFDKLIDQNCEKFEAEGQGAIVEQQKFREPLAEFTKARVVSSQRDTEKPQEALPKKICKEVAKKTVSEQIRIVPEGKENPRMRREMSVQERDQLGLVLQDFAGEYLEEILQIVAKRNSNMTAPDGDGEIELDIQAVDSETMWDLHRFFRLKLKAKQNNMIAIEEEIAVGD